MKAFIYDFKLRCHEPSTDCNSRWSYINQQEYLPSQIQNFPWSDAWAITHAQDNLGSEYGTRMLIDGQKVQLRQALFEEEFHHAAFRRLAGSAAYELASQAHQCGLDAVGISSDA